VKKLSLASIHRMLAELIRLCHCIVNLSGVS